MGSPDIEKLEDPPAAPKWRRWLVVGAWLTALVVALMLDSRVMNLAKQYPLNKHSWLSYFMKLPGDYPFNLALIGLIIILFRQRGIRAAGHIALAGISSGTFYCIIKWTVGRRRPGKAPPFEFRHFTDGWSGFLNAENLSFPSGHVTFAFATAAVMALHFPRVKRLCYAGASMVAAERVWENAHYLADVVAGAMLGIFSAYVIVWIFGAIEQKKTLVGFDVIPVIDDANGSHRILKKAV